MTSFFSLSRGVLNLARPKTNFRALRDASAILWKNRDLCREIVRRELGSQVVGEALGAFWIIGHPMMLFCVYIFVFVFVFKTRIAESLEMPRDYTTYILSGLVPWLFVQQSLVRGANALVGQANLVKQVVFPVEVLPFAAVVTSLVTLGVGLTILIIYSLIAGGGLPWTYVLLPLVIGAHIVLMSGIAFLLAGITPFFRDVKDVIQVLTIVGVYVIPAFYLPQWVPGPIRVFLYLNPFSYVIWVYQDVLYFGELNHPFAWVVLLFSSLLSFALGYRAFRAVKLLVANVI
jgi:lipopolysaccharide transport system permease protein